MSTRTILASLMFATTLLVDTYPIARVAAATAVAVSIWADVRHQRREREREERSA